MFKFLKKRVSGTGQSYDDKDVKRLDLRAKFIIDKNRADIAGSSVLDLASHDGRWPYAFAEAGAARVVGIEGRQELVNLFSRYPDDAHKKKVDLRVGDIFEWLEKLNGSQATFDVVGVLGIFYHIMDHYRLLRLVTQLKPKLIIVDSEFALQQWPMVQISRERTDHHLNSTAYFGGQKRVPIGRPSRPALEVMAETLGYSTEWFDWEEIPAADRGPVPDYYRPAEYRRFTCILRPIPAQPPQARGFFRRKKPTD